LNTAASEVAFSLAVVALLSRRDFNTDDTPFGPVPADKILKRKSRRIAPTAFVFNSAANPHATANCRST
jgi:hypothetical protein